MATEQGGDNVQKRIRLVTTQASASMGSGDAEDISRLASMPRGPTLAGSIPPLDFARMGTSMTGATEWARPEGGWSTERLSHRPMDPISLRRSRHVGEIEVMEHSERGPTPLPEIKGLRKRSIALRTDGLAAMIPTLQVYPSNGLSGLKLGAMKGKLGNALNVLAGKMKVQADFHSVVDQVREHVRKGPSVGARVVVNLKAPFLGYRAEGQVKYVGAVPEMGNGIWLGLELEKGVGLHDGMGYFKCRTTPGSEGPYYGTFIRGSQIEFCSKMSDGLYKDGVRELSMTGKNLKQIKFWKDPFKPVPHPRAVDRKPYVPGLSVLSNPPAKLNFHKSGAVTAR